MKNIILLLIINIGFSSCSRNFFKVESTTDISEVDWQMVSGNNKNIILHTTGNTVELIDIKNENTQIVVTVMPHYPIRPEYTIPEPGYKNHSYKMKDKKELMNRVQLYTGASLPDNLLRVTIQKNDVVQISTYKHAKTATDINHIASLLLPVLTTYTIFILMMEVAYMGH